MKVKNIILLPIVCFYILLTGIISCITKVYDEKSQKAFFSNSPVNIRDYIETDGYYRCDSDFYSWFMTNNLLIYNDNSFAFFLWNDADSQPIERQKMYEDSLCKIQDIDILENICFYNWWRFSPTDPFYKKYKGKLNGGAYKTENNILVLEHPVILNFSKRALCRNTFRIIDRRTLRREIFQIITNDSTIQFDTIATFRFVPAHNLPSSLSIREKKYKWMWKNRDDWQLFKSKRKEYRKSLKLYLRK